MYVNHRRRSLANGTMADSSLTPSVKHWTGAFGTCGRGVGFLRHQRWKCGAVSPGNCREHHPAEDQKLYQSIYQRFKAEIVGERGFFKITYHYKSSLWSGVSIVLLNHRFVLMKKYHDPLFLLSYPTLIIFLWNPFPPTPTSTKWHDLDKKIYNITGLEKWTYIPQVIVEWSQRRPPSDYGAKNWILGQALNTSYVYRSTEPSAPDSFLSVSLVHRTT